MQRRDVLRLLAVGATIPVLPPTLLAHIREAQNKVNSGTYTLRTLSPEQNKQVVIMTDLIIPETDTPGAKGAKVNEFIDLLLTEWFETEEKQRFLQGLSTIDSASRKRFSADFVSCTPVQQAELIKQFDDGAMNFAHSRPALVTTRTASA